VVWQAQYVVRLVRRDPDRRVLVWEFATPAAISFAKLGAPDAS
jgi:hypothetical protein